MRRPATVLFLILVALYALTLSGHFASPDEEVLFRVTRAVATRGSVAVEPIAAGFATYPSNPPRPDGREYAQYGIGQPVAAVPFYYLGGVLHRVVPDSFWARIAQRMRTIENVIGAPSQEPLNVVARDTALRFALSLFNTLITAFSGVLLFMICGRLTGNSRAAFLAALLWGCGSIAWPHARTFFTEPLAAMCLLCSLAILAHYFIPPAPEQGWPPVRKGGSCDITTGCPFRPFIAGFAAGYACLVRLDSILFLPGLVLIVAWGDYDRKGQGFACLVRYCFKARTLIRLALFTLPVLICGAFILLMNHQVSGQWLSSGYSDQSEGIRFSTPLAAGLYGFLFSVGKGLFFFSPALLLAFFGLRAMFQKQVVFALGCAAIFGIFFLAMCKWQNWAGGWCWGPRHIIQIHALLAIPIAFWLAEDWTPARRVIVTAFLVVAGTVQIYGCSQSAFEYYHVHFRDPHPPSARILYDPQNRQAYETMFAMYQRDPRTGQPTKPVSITQTLPAPINDSIYLPQNSQWAGYGALWRLRRTHDFFWLHAARSAGPKDAMASPDPAR